MSSRDKGRAHRDKLKTAAQKAMFDSLVMRGMPPLDAYRAVLWNCELESKPTEGEKK